MTKLVAVFLLFFSVSIAPALAQHDLAPGAAPHTPLPASPFRQLQLLEHQRAIDDGATDLEERNERMRTDNTGPCTDAEKRLSYFGMDHCRLHQIYQKIFPQSGCYCSTGQCRPTTFNRVAVTADNPTGVEVEISGKFYPVPEAALREMIRGKIPDALLEYEAHVCAYEHPNVVIECVWIAPRS